MVFVMIHRGTSASVSIIQNGSLRTRCYEKLTAKLVLKEQLPLAIAQNSVYTQFRGFNLEDNHYMILP